MSYQLGPLTVLSHDEPATGAWSVRLRPEGIIGAYPWWRDATRLVIESMAPLNLVGRRVLDFGCGSSAILSLAAHMRGARVTAYDHVPEMTEGARRQVAGYEIRVVDEDDGSDYDVILANIGNEPVVRLLCARAPFVIGTAKRGDLIRQGC